MKHTRIFAAAPGLDRSQVSVDAGPTKIESLYVIAVMIAMASYQGWLCLLYTLGAPTSVAWVGGSEALLIASTLPILLRRLSAGLIMIVLLAAAWFCLAKLLTGQFLIKTPRDLIAPLCFFWLGSNIGRPDLVERGLVITMVFVLAVGFVELFWLDSYTQVMDIFGYYVSTGNLQPITDYVRESRLQLNGIRPDGIGRTLLPGVLGSHRVSSVFLEPVSLGNFATMVAAWGLSRDTVQWRQGALFVIAAIVMMIMADSRFTLMLLPIMVAMRLVLSGGGLKLAVLAPFAAVALILVVGVLVPRTDGDNLFSRLAISGWALLRMDGWMLLGLGSQPGFVDMGYAYMISRFGVPLTLIIWFGFWLLPMPNERGERFRAFMSMYIALILCISGTSLFAFKSSALLWFLLGSLLSAPALPVPRPRLQASVNQRWHASGLPEAKLHAS